MRVSVFQSGVVLPAVATFLMMAVPHVVCLEPPAGFPTVDSVRVRASRLNIHPSQHPEFLDWNSTFEQAIFPNVRFTCTQGTIKNIWFVGRVFDPFATEVAAPSFQTWRLSSDNIDRDALSTQHYVHMPIETSARFMMIPNNMVDTGVVKLTTNSIPFINNDVLGVTVLLSSNATVTPLFLPSTEQRTVHFGSVIPHKESLRFSLTENEILNNAFPLIAIESDPPDCVQGTLKPSVLNALVARIGFYRHQLRVIPELTFNCSRYISSISIAAQFQSVETSVRSQLKLALWNCSFEECNRLSTHTISRAQEIPEFPGIYRIDGVNFENKAPEGRGYYSLGIDQPPHSNVLLYYQQGVGPVNYFQNSSDQTLLQFDKPDLSQYRDLPLILPAYRKSSGVIPRECTSGFIDMNTLKERSFLLRPTVTNISPPQSDSSQLDSDGTSSEYLYLFTGLPFQAPGNVSRFIIAATRSASTTSAPLLYPQVHIWRQRKQGTLIREFTTTRVPSRLQGELNMYEYRESFQYLAGDFLGMYQPMNLVLAIGFQESASNSSYRIKITSMNVPERLDSNVMREPISYTPVLTVEAQEFSLPSATTPITTGTTTPESTTTPSMPPPTRPTDPTDPTVGMTDPTVTMEKSSESTGTTVAGETGSNSSIDVITIAGAAVGGVIGILVFLILALVVFLLVMRCRKKTKLDSMDNPEYYSSDNRDVSSPSSPPTNSNYALVNDINNPAYEVPVTRARPQPDTVVYQTVGEAAQPYETPSILRSTANQLAQEYETPSISRSNAMPSGAAGQGENHYHILEPGNASESTRNGSRHIYHTLEPGQLQGSNRLSQDEQVVAETEIDVIVPTGDQRRNVEASKEEDLYASLKIIQAGDSMKSSGSYFEESDTYWRPASSPTQLYQQLSSKKYREIPRHMIRITDQIGSGNFGDVHKGVWHTARGDRAVAVKKLKESANSADRVTFLQEAAVNGQFRHPNVVSLLGVVTIGDPVMIVLELMENGDLRSYLKDNFAGSPASDWPQTLLTFCQHIAAGMDYLSKKSFIHRDLAARNVLVTAGKTCKITDFGMSRETEQNYYMSQGGVLPVKWTAPEALNYKKFSTASDVWSYGCVLYEIWSLGHKPFPKHKNLEAVELIEEGYRLPPPPGCPRAIYQLMIQCWHPIPSSRPSFSDLLASLLDSESELLRLEEDNDNPNTNRLGGHLKHSKNMYMDLQTMYKSSS